VFYVGEIYTSQLCLIHTFDIGLRTTPGLQNHFEIEIEKDTQKLWVPLYDGQRKGLVGLNGHVYGYILIV
jgi:hypothetical protein